MSSKAERTEATLKRLVLRSMSRVGGGSSSELPRAAKTALVRSASRRSRGVGPARQARDKQSTCATNTKIRTRMAPLLWRALLSATAHSTGGRTAAEHRNSSRRTGPL
eukprot:scaffold7096_cov253-Pinguiococcus_pyrenoidosus.AAC.5